MEKKILLGRNIGEKKAGEMPEQLISGPVCPLPNAKSDVIYKGGAMTSAFMSVFL